MRTECKREKLEFQPCGARQVIKERGDTGWGHTRSAAPGCYALPLRGKRI